MTPDRWQRVKELFEAALERAPGERSDFLREACGEDESLRAELESLLAEEHVVGGFLSNDATKTMQASSWNIGAPAARTLPTAIGHYRIIGFVGKGGMAVVYKAEQQEPRRIVALKVIKPGLVGPEYERRFEREKDALARLQHEGIARIYEAGTADSGSGPQPYFAMELIEQGQPLTEYAETKRLTTRQRLDLMAQMCDAVHHAHQHFIIHRDLKPSNILVDEHGHAKVLDFGVARITDSDIGATRQTDVGQLVGTLEYMSPEQARGDPSQVDTRSDIYALGVILYELLAAKLPYDLRDKSLLEALAIILTQDPAKLGSINRQYRGDIETIAAKCLEKDKALRYSSAAELAADIRHYLSSEPIIARPASFGYQLTKFARRNKVAVGGATAVFAVLVAGIIGTSWQARVAIRERNTAQARELLSWANGSLTEDPERSLILGLYSWDKSRRMAGGLEQLLHDAVLQSSALLTLRGHQASVSHVAWSPDGNKLATTSLDGTAKLWETRTGRELFTLHAVIGIAWSPDGRRLATASNGPTAKIWDSSTGRLLLTVRGHEDESAGVVGARNEVFGAAWSPDGSKLATASLDETAKVWAASTGRELLTIHGRISEMAWSPDGRKLAAVDERGAEVWDGRTGGVLLTLPGQYSATPAWSADGSKLATGDTNGVAKIWDTRTGRESLAMRGHEGGLTSIAWSPDGTELATGGADKTAKVWDASSGRELLTFRGHQSQILSVAWSPDGTRLATGGFDNTARIWDVGPRRELLILREARPFFGVAWSPDGSRIATAGEKGAELWEVRTGREVLTLGDDRVGNAVTFSPDGRRLATADDDSTGRVWDAYTGRELLALSGHGSRLFGITWSPDGSRLATASEDRTAKVWEADTGRELRTFRGPPTRPFEHRVVTRREQARHGRGHG